MAVSQALRDLDQAGKSADDGLRFLPAKGCFDDPSAALIKTRQFAERLSVRIAESAGVPVDQRPGFVDVLRLIQMDGAAPREVLDILHRLRRFGNAAAHDVLGERRDAFEAVKLCHRLGVWWRATSTGNPKLTIAFIPPQQG